MLTRRLSRRLGDECGSLLALLAVLMPLFLVVGAIVLDLGVFFEHRRQMQTKVDAAALAAGGKWVFPCNPAIDAAIEAEARKYVGPHTKSDGNPGPATTLNEQVGGTNPSDVHVVLNATQYWEDTGGPQPQDWSDGAGTVCDSQHLDVRGTEANVNAFFGFMTPDVRAKARVEIQKALALEDLMPISVRIPEPLSAAAVFYDETTGNLATPASESVKYLTKTTTVSPVPSSLVRWTTLGGIDLAGDPVLPNPASFNIPSERTGVVIAVSFFPRCEPGGGPPPGAPGCFEDGGFANVNDLCRQGSSRIVQCFYATGFGVSQTVQAGLEMIRGYVNLAPGPTDPQVLEQVWLEPDTCRYANQAGTEAAYFNAFAGSCRIRVAASVDVGGDRDGDPLGPFSYSDDVEVMVAPVGCNNWSSCGIDMEYDAGEVWKTDPGVGPTLLQVTNDDNRFKIRVRMRDTTVNGVPCPTGTFGCEVIFGDAANPVQRSFVGDDEASGPIKFMRVYVDPDGDGIVFGGEDATNSQIVGSNQTFYVDLGLRGPLAASQSDPPFTFNLKGSQSGVIDCDPNLNPDPKAEVIAGCGPLYKPSPLDLDPPCPSVSNINQLVDAVGLGPPWTARWATGIECVVTKTGNPRQLLDGFAERILAPPQFKNCPMDAPTFVPGRNYWSDANNMDDTYTFPNLRDDDPRYVTLFLTAYDSFTGNGNEVFPIIGFAKFYVTGWATFSPGQGLVIEDPCPGNDPPPDLITESGGAYVWGHFVVDVTPDNSGGGTGDPCDPKRLDPCVAVLVE